MVLGQGGWSEPAPSFLCSPNQAAPCVYVLPLSCVTQMPVTIWLPFPGETSLQTRLSNSPLHPGAPHLKSMCLVMEGKKMLSHKKIKWGNRLSLAAA